MQLTSSCRKWNKIHRRHIKCIEYVNRFFVYFVKHPPTELFNLSIDERRRKISCSIYSMSQNCGRCPTRNKFYLNWE